MRHIKAQPDPKRGVEGPIALIMAPTRELATQICKEAQSLGKVCDVTVQPAIGGTPIGEQLGAIKRGCHAIVGTPGRMVDIFSISGGKVVNLYRVSFFVLDEADRMMDLGFQPQISDFFNKTQKTKQIVMFSATFPESVKAVAQQYLKKVLQIKIGVEGTAGGRRGGVEKRLSSVLFDLEWMVVIFHVVVPTLSKKFGRFQNLDPTRQ